jgi:hypothetical protein
MTMICELEVSCVSLTEVSSRHMPGRAEEIRENTQSE